MKGDFSRLSFRQRHYLRVLQQQGRPVLDADWNEQVAILLDRLAQVTGDITGGGESRAAGPEGSVGFVIDKMDPLMPNNFTISAGRYYVDGLCCECEAPVTYQTQPLPPDPNADTDGIHLAYLDAWESVVGPLDESTIVEPALAGVDTSLRTRVVWQVRTHRLPHRSEDDEADFEKLRGEVREVLRQMRSPNRGSLKIGLAGAADQAGRNRGPGPRAGHFRGVENLLYRIEVHEGGRAGRATFKWSRENGAILLPLAGLDGEAGHVPPRARRALAHLAKNAWLEITNRQDRLLGRHRPMVRVDNVDAATGEITLKQAPAGIDGKAHDLGLRRWDQLDDAGPNGIAIVESDSEAHWVDLEDGIQIQFQPAGDGHHHEYRTGDYWLIPARTADEGVLLRRRNPQPPDGIHHVYAPLRLVIPRTGNVSWNYTRDFPTLEGLNEQVASLRNDVHRLTESIEELRRQLPIASKA